MLLENSAGADDTGFDVNFRLASSGVSAKIGTIRTNSPGAGDTDMFFSTSTNGSSVTEALRLDSQNATFSGDVSLSAGALSITGDGSNATVMSESGSGDFEINTVVDIILDAGGGDILLRDDGSGFGQISNNSQDLEIRTSTNDKDMLFRGYDNGSIITALNPLDMS